MRDAASAVGVKRVTFGREKESSFFWKEHGSLPYCKVLSWEESEEKGKVRTRVLFCLVLVKNSEINYCKLYPMVGKTESLIHEVSVYNAPTEVESYVRDSIEEIAKFLGLYGVHLGSLESDYEDDDGESRKR